MSESKTKKRERSSRFKEQKMMRRVLLALTPALLGAIVFFGWRSAFLCVWIMLWGCATEYVLARRRGDPLTESCLVTGMLLALSLPPTLPLWMGTVGIVVAIAFGKEFFGGFGRNVFNPAIVGRAFLYVAFPGAMTRGFVPVYAGGWRGLLHWGPRINVDGLDAVSAATPMWAWRDFGYHTPFLNMVTGSIHGTFRGSGDAVRILAAGSMGEVSAILLLLGGLYLLWSKTAQWRLALSCLVGGAGFAALVRYGFGVEAVPPTYWALCSGGFLYAAFFMVTDPVSAPKDKTTQLIYGAFIGAMIVFFRWKAVFAGGVGFAILLGNTVGPSVEMFFKGRKQRQRNTLARNGKGEAGT